MQNKLIFLLFLTFIIKCFEHSPESQSLIPSTTNSTAVRTKRHMQDSVFMSLQFSNFRHVGILPNGYLIPTESMRGDNLIFIEFIP